MTTLHIVFDRVLTNSVEAKTADGRSYRDIESELLAKLPATDHQLKEIGYNKQLGVKCQWAFVPYWRLRERIREIVGSAGFRFEIVTTYINHEGVPVMVGVLNILGVEMQGIGYGNSHDSYKGNRDEIAYADAFKNAAEAHGLGSYLDNQIEVARYLMQSGNTEAIANGRLLAVQFQKANKISSAEVRAAASSEASPKAKSAPSKPAPQAEPQPQFLYPQHNILVKGLRKQLGLSQAYILEKLEGMGTDAPGNLDPEKLTQLLKTMATEWAVSSGEFSSLKVAASALDGAIATNSQTPPHKVIQNWVTTLEKELTP